MAARYDLKVDQGSTFRFLFTYEDNEGNSVDLSNYSIEMQIRRSIEDDKLVCLLNENWPSGCIFAGLSGEFEKGNGTTGYTGGIILNYNGVTGQVFVEIDSESSFSFNKPKLFYDLEIRGSDDYLERVLHGTINISRTIHSYERVAPGFLEQPILTITGDN